jgi:IS6 family transposase
MAISAANPFKGRQYAGEVILTAVRWYLRYPLAYEHVSELLAERGLAVDASCVSRWVQAYAAELSKRCRVHLKATNKSYRVDEAYIKVKGQEKYLYRAVDSTGQTIDFLLTAKREGVLLRRVRLRQCKYLNNIVEQDHRSVKKRIWLAKGYGSFRSAQRTLKGIETVNMIRKGRVRWVASDDVKAQARFVANLFGIAA